MPEIFTAAELGAMHLPALRWIIQGLMPEGYHVLVGPPKQGKSMLAMDLACAAATGAKALDFFDVAPCDVLYLALEDGKRRLQERLDMRLGSRGKWPERLAMSTKWPRMGPAQGKEEVRNWLEEHPRAGLVVIDVLEHFRKRDSGKTNAYREDYDSMDGIGELAEKYHVAILVLHHTRKAASDDFVGAASGTHGLTGNADGVFSLKRDRHSSEGVLERTGRDCDEEAFDLRFEGGLWTCLGTKADELKDTNATIVRVVRDAEQAVTPTYVSEQCGISLDSAKQSMRRLEKRGQIERLSRGQYRAAAGMTMDKLRAKPMG